MKGLKLAQKEYPNNSRSHLTIAATWSPHTAGSTEHTLWEAVKHLLVELIIALAVYALAIEEAAIGRPQVHEVRPHSS